MQAAQFSQLAPLGAGRIQASWRLVLIVVVECALADGLRIWVHSFAGSAPAPAPSPAPAPVSAPAAPIKSAPVDPPAPQVVADPAPAPSAASAPTSDSIVSAPAPDAPAPATAQGCDPACGSGVHWSTGTCVSGSCVCIAGWTGSACDVPDAGWASSV